MLFDVFYYNTGSYDTQSLFRGKESILAKNAPQPTNAHLTNGPTTLRSLLCHSEYTSGYGVTLLVAWLPCQYFLLHRPATIV